MSTEHMVLDVDKRYPRGRPIINWDGVNLGSLSVKCHPSDDAVMRARIRKVIATLGGTNVRFERPQ